MTIQRLIKVSHVLLWTASFTAAASLLLQPTASIAQTTRASGNSPDKATTGPQRSRINVSGKRGVPSRRFGGGSRVGKLTQNGKLNPLGCTAAPQGPQAIPQAIAMIAPADNVTVTTSAQPTLMLWLNESTQTKNLELTLRQGATGEGPELYRKLVALPGETGLVTLDLAALDDAPSLMQDEDYYVYLSLVCDASDRSKDMVAEGRLSYISNEQLPLKAAQEPASALVQRQPSPFLSIEQSLELGLWHDAMVQLNDLRRHGQTQAIRQQAQQRWRQQLVADDELYVLADQTNNAIAPLAITDAPELDDF